MTENTNAQHAVVPMEHVGPVRIVGPEVDGEFMVPLATYETPLWPSVRRGARVRSVRSMSSWRGFMARDMRA